MTAGGEIEEVEQILSETIAALSRLQTDELEELERRAARLMESLSSEGLQATRSKADLLSACLNTTAENLKVLYRLRGERRWCDGQPDRVDEYVAVGAAG
jgi:hypothetical protein